MKRGFRRKASRPPPSWRWRGCFTADFYYGVRKYIYESPVLEDKEQMISDALEVFLAGFGRVFAAPAAPKRAPVKAVG